MLQHFLWRFIEMADIMFGWISRPALVQSRQHAVFDRHRVETLLHHIILVHHVAEEMPVIEFDDQLIFNLLR